MALFFVAIPLGSGLGFVAGSKMVQFARLMKWGGWEWSLRVTPPLGFISFILLLIVMPGYIPRGYSDGLYNETVSNSRSSFAHDLKYLKNHKSFCSITSGFIGVAFTMGSLSLWFPQFISLAAVLRGELEECKTTDCDYAQTMLKFGIYTSVGGLLGIFLGLWGSATWKREKNGKPGNTSSDVQLN